LACPERSRLEIAIKAALLSDDKSLPACRRLAERRGCAPGFGVVETLDGVLFGAMVFGLTEERTVLVVALVVAFRDGFLAALLVALARAWGDVVRVAFRAGFLAAFLAIFLVTFLPTLFVVRLRDFAAAFLFAFSRFTISPFWGSPRKILSQASCQIQPSQQ
jgi:hypothetical protein